MGEWRRRPRAGAAAPGGRNGDRSRPACGRGSAGPGRAGEGREGGLRAAGFLFMAGQVVSKFANNSGLYVLRFNPRTAERAHAMSDLKS